MIGARRLWATGVTLLGLGASACGGGGDGGGTGPAPEGALKVVGGGNNLPDRYSSDLWVHGGYVYTGTWGGAARNGHLGDALEIWQLDADGAPVLVDSVKVSPR
jgi:hypothetical protein